MRVDVGREINRKRQLQSVKDMSQNVKLILASDSRIFENVNSFWINVYNLSNDKNVYLTPIQFFNARYF